MKIIFTLTVFVVFSLMASPAQSSSVTNNPADKGEKNKSITIGSNRASGDMLVRFTAEKAGTVSIEVLNESGKVVLQQTNKVTNSINAIPLKQATSLNEGHYTVRLTSNNETFTTQFLIWK